nr:MAG: zer-1-like protein [Metapenaeus ensis nimavirus]
MATDSRACVYKSRFYCHGYSFLNLVETTMENSPRPLIRLCGTYLVSNMESFCVQEQGTDLWRLAPGVKLPQEICEYLILCWNTVCDKFPNNKFLSIFRDTAKTNLRVVILRGIPLTDENLTILLNHNIEELHLINCWTLTKTGLENIEKHKSLRVLVIVDHSIAIQRGTKDPTRIPLMRNLNKLVIKSIRIGLESPDPSEINNLKHFEYGPLPLPFSLGSLPDIKNLTVLKIPNMSVHPDNILPVLELISLVVLDISSHRRCHQIEHKVTWGFLKKLVETLKKLMSLDISGTKLLAPTYGNAAFETRMKRPFDFVGVYSTFRTSKCQIPAVEVAGDTSEKEYMVAIKTYASVCEVGDMVLFDFLLFVQKNPIIDERKVFCTVIEVAHAYCKDRARQGPILSMVNEAVTTTFFSPRRNLLSHLSRRIKLTSQEQLLMMQYLLDMLEMTFYKMRRGDSVNWGLWVMTNEIIAHLYTSSKAIILLSHDVEELHLIDCWILTKVGLEDTGRHGKSLQVSVIVEFSKLETFTRKVESPIIIPPTRHLKKLVICSERIGLESPDPSEINNLKHFEYGPLPLPFSLGSLPDIKNLTVLKIPNMSVHPDNILPVLELISLVVLDISTHRRCHQIEHKDTWGFLKKLVETLKKLMSLDISGTKLLAPTYGNAAFETRMKRPFDFVGVYSTFRTSKCQIPAVEVAGDTSEKEYMVAIKTYASVCEVGDMVLFDFLLFVQKNPIIDERKVFCTVIEVAHAYCKDRARQGPILSMVNEAVTTTFFSPRRNLLSHLSRRIKLTSQEQLLMMQYLLDMLEMTFYKMRRGDSVNWGLWVMTNEIIAHLYTSSKAIVSVPRLLLAS